MDFLFELILEIFGGLTEDFLLPAFSKKIDARITSKPLRNLIKVLIFLLCLGVAVGVAAAVILLISLIIKNMH
jgi:hypothetical protein